MEKRTIDMVGACPFSEHDIVHFRDGSFIVTGFSGTGESRVTRVELSRIADPIDAATIMLLRGRGTPEAADILANG